MREFLLLPVVLGAATLLIAFVLFVFIPVSIGYGLVLLIGERQGWARIDGFYGDHDDAGLR